MLLIVSLGYSVVKQTLGRVMIRVRILAVAHFIFGVAYSLGLTLALESDGFWLLFMIFPLAFTLTAFMMWIMSALAASQYRPSSQTTWPADMREQQFAISTPGSSIIRSRVGSSPLEAAMGCR